MNLTSYTYLLENPSTVGSSQTKELETVLDNFPYFQSAHVLYLKGLQQQESFQYNQQLKTTAAYTTNRSVLFDFITNNSFTEIPTKEELIPIEEIQVVDAQVIEELHKQINTKINTEENTVILEGSTRKTLNKILNTGKPLQFNSNESHSFNEWLQLSAIKPIQRKETSEKKKKNQLIETFIEQNPKISPIKNTTSPIDISQKTNIDSSLMTETLAKVYIEQQKFDNAIQAYKILCLKYPEKSGFFADQIKTVQLLQKNKS